MAGRKKAPRLFTAIDVGSFELCMKIFEISAKGLRQIDSLASLDTQVAQEEYMADCRTRERSRGQWLVFLSVDEKEPS